MPFSHISRQILIFPIIQFCDGLKTSFLLGIHIEKTIIQRHMHPNVHSSTRTWKQPKCPSTEEWIKKMWYIYTMEYYSAIKRNEIGSFVEVWMDLETVIQSEVSQKEKNKYGVLIHICGI